MKTKILPLILLATAPFAFAQEETPTYTDLYYAGDLNESPWNSQNTRYMCHSAVWKVGSLEGETLTTTPNSKYNNLFIQGHTTVSSTTPTGYDYLNWEVNNLTIDLTYKARYWGVQVCGGGQTFKVNGDLNASLDNAYDWNNSAAGINLQGTSTFEILGDLNITNTTDPTTRIDTVNNGDYNGVYHNNGIIFAIDTDVSFKKDDISGNISNVSCDTSFTLYGDVNMFDNDINSAYAPWGAKYNNSRITFRIDALYSAIKGVVYMEETYVGERVLDLCSRRLSEAESIGLTFDEVSREFGGWSGSSALVSSVDRKKTIDIIFTNADKYDWTGNILAAHEETAFNILMDAQSANGKQSLFVEEKHGTNMGDNLTYKGSFNEVTVVNGTLELGGYSELVNGTLTISGKNARFAVGGSVKDTLGKINFTSATVNSGTLTIGFNQESSDVLNVVKVEENADSGTFYVADPSAFVIELDYLPVEDSVLKEQLESEGSFVYDIVYFDSTNLTAESISDITVKVVDQYGNAISGVEAFLTLIGEEGAYTGISATIQSAVPEPATVAGIAGMLALAFVAYRRRK